MTDDAKGWIVDSLKGTSLLAILAAVASGAWLLADMSSQIQTMRAALEAQDRMRVGSRLTAVEHRLESFSRDQKRMEQEISKDFDRMTNKLDRLGERQ